MSDFLADYRKKQQERWAAQATTSTAAQETQANEQVQANENACDAMAQDIDDIHYVENFNDDKEAELEQLNAMIAEEKAKHKREQEAYDLEFARKLQEEFDAEYAATVQQQQQSTSNNYQEAATDERVAEPYVDRLIIEDQDDELLPPQASNNYNQQPVSNNSSSNQIPIQHSRSRNQQQHSNYTVQHPQQQPLHQNHQQVFEQIVYRTGANGEPIRLRKVIRNNNGHVEEFVEQLQPQQGPSIAPHHIPASSLMNGGIFNNRYAAAPSQSSLMLLDDDDTQWFNQQQGMNMFGGFASNPTFRYMQRRMAQMRQRAANMFNL